MRRYIVKRILLMLLLLLGMSFIVFASLYIAPGDPATMVAGPSATEADIEAVRASLGLDRPFLVSRNRIRVKERDGKSETGKGRESQSYQGKQRTSMRRPPRRGRALSSSTRTAARGSSGGFLYS